MGAKKAAEYVVVKVKGQKLWMYFPDGTVQYTSQRKHAAVMFPGYADQAIAAHTTEDKALEREPA